MYSNYLCPKCRGHLRVGHNVILSAYNGKGVAALVLLNPEPGNYSVDHHPSVEFEKGELVTFYCSICHSDLSSVDHKNLAMVIMTDDSGKDFNIYFSRIAGEHSTIKMMGEHVELYGPHSKDYEDLFNLGMMI